MVPSNRRVAGTRSSRFFEAIFSNLTIPASPLPRRRQYRRDNGKERMTLCQHPSPECNSRYAEAIISDLTIPAPPFPRDNNIRETTGKKG
ncbi:hypothetical protein J6590_083380 [Homalodisca vitripennis]|nr:hypothetical protein J6590_083380 [Homalodisca vitripennis]